MSGPLVLTVDVEGVVETNEYHSVTVLDEVLEDLAVPATLFVTPAVVRHRPSTVGDWLDGAHEVALHVHPGRLGGESDWLATYDVEEIADFLRTGCSTFEDQLGVKPSGFRAGRWSFSEDVLVACSRAGLEWDASLRPSRRQDPYAHDGIAEYPLSVYSSPLVAPLLRSYDVDAIPLAADALATSRFRTGVLYAAAWRLLAADSPYTMVSFHDYDLTDADVRRRIERFVARLTAGRPVTTLPGPTDENSFLAGRDSSGHGTGTR